MARKNGGSAATVKRLEAYLARKWVALALVGLAIWVILPWLAPVFMKLGWEAAASTIYAFYSFQCHQLPQRSFFLFGPQPMLSLEQIQSIWVDTPDPVLLREFVGSQELGYKVAWSDRMVSAYSSIPLAGLIWRRLKDRLPILPGWGLALLALPMLADGLTHLASDLAGLGQGFRYGNAWLADLTRHSLPDSFYRGTVLGSFNSCMRLITGAMFGSGLAWFAFGNFDRAMQLSERARRLREGISAKGKQRG